MQAGLKERPASWEDGREKRPLQDTLGQGQCVEVRWKDTQACRECHWSAGGGLDPKRETSGPRGVSHLRWEDGVLKRRWWHHRHNAAGREGFAPTHPHLPLCFMLKRRWCHHRHNAAGREGFAPTHPHLPLCCMLKRRWWHHRHNAAGREGFAPTSATLLHVEEKVVAPSAQRCR